MHVIDVANYFAQREDEEQIFIAPRLCYYCYMAQGWHMAWNDGEPLFEEDFVVTEAGPFIMSLFDLTDEGKLHFDGAEELPEKIADEMDSIYKVCKSMSTTDLLSLIQDEEFWKEDPRPCLGTAIPKDVIRKQYQEYFESSQKKRLTRQFEKEIEKLLDKIIAKMAEVQEGQQLDEEIFLKAYMQTVGTLEQTVKDTQNMQHRDEAIYKLLKMIMTISIQGCALFAHNLKEAGLEPASLK